MREHRHVLSIAQDIIYYTTGGYVKTPKHVALPMAVRHLIGSTQLVTIPTKQDKIGDEEGDDVPLNPGL